MKKSMVKRVLLVASLTLSPLAQASSSVYGLHLRSIHEGSATYNNSNLGAYVRMGNGLTLGAYHNSERKLSTYIGYSSDYGPITVTVGLITGYSRSPVMPFLIPSIKIGRVEDVTFRLGFIPKISKQGAAAIHLMAEF